MSGHDALVVRGLVKRFGGFTAVNDLDLTVRRGELYALLGPNGAGKTTTLRIVAGLLSPDAGEVSICGINRLRDPVAAKRVVAWLPDEPMVYDKLTPVEYLDFVAGLWQVEPAVTRQRRDALLETLDLTRVADQRCEGFSKGMRQKVALAGALIHEPDLLILDEPLTGLDASMARHVKDLLQDRVATGVTVILTTHILEVAERLSDRIGIIRQGRLVCEGTMAELRDGSASQGSTLEDVFLDVVARGEAA
ncbi:MAG TPA: ABC transporter ATP-binding protein [Bosea sp. (in: a-proteobacteria)]|jgi:ABC-2 type transport system ATP-binding protein|uniref:ABC transporter ATP-binding protein n=1 Tax=Bosea sp. (in: a-proteobacteria) TaxID=1871050 RepID=UPI002DDD6AE3|nr:ABC transporter ATP-binding protein [Bosea sp. (in: a-proteobacteria)]HEV2555327.1 ABC transporter ATP-binding protein [Bosea sp. (in: a-proteobacteria)]